jgi:uncharacterized OsmC-like protein
MESLKETIEATAAALAARPDRATRTFRTVTHARGGLQCETEIGDHRVVTDLVLTRGGAAGGPTPSHLVGAAVGSCVATAFVLEAARLDIPIDSVEVTVEGEVDARGLFGVAAVAPGYAALRYTVVVSSSAPAARLQELSDHVDRRSPVLDDLRRSIPVAAGLRIVETA